MRRPPRSKKRSAINTAKCGARDPARLAPADVLALSGGGDGAFAAPFAFLGPDYDAPLREIYTRYSDNDLYFRRGLLGLAGNALNDTRC